MGKEKKKKALLIFHVSSTKQKLLGAVEWRQAERTRHKMPLTQNTCPVYFCMLLFHLVNLAF